MVRSRSLDSGMTYAVKEMFYTLQGEGAQGRPRGRVLPLRRLHLWTGREQDREKAVCTFCDTDFVGTDGQGGGKFARPMPSRKPSTPSGPRTSTAARPARRMSSVLAASRCCSSMVR